MHFVINPTKLRPPVRKGVLIERSRLLERIDTHERTRLTLVQAPSGFGKTSLLFQLLERMKARRIRTVWLGLDAADNNYACFLAHLIRALKQVGLRLDGRATQIVRAGLHPPPAVAAAVLSSALARLEHAAVIFIDDYHLLTDPQIGQLMTAVTRSSTGLLSWVLAARRLPTHLPLARLRVAQELTEIGMVDLQFCESEAEDFLCRASRLKLDAAQVRALNRRAEGWAAALQMVVLVLRNSREPDLIIERFSGASRNVAQLLDEEVLLHLDEPLLRFLLDTSVLSRMSAELCNAITERTDARRMLDRLEAMNLFIVALDDERGWYRFHHFFAEFLNRRLLESDPARASLLHSRASSWFEAHQQDIEAVEHALMARDFMRAARLLNQAHLYNKGYIGRVDHYARQIPEDVLELFPDLQLERIWEWQARWDYARVRPELRRLSRKVALWAGGREAPPPNVDVATLQAKLAHREMVLSFVADDMSDTQRRCLKWISAGYSADEFTNRAVEVAHMAAQREHYQAQESIAPEAVRHRSHPESPYDYGAIFHDSMVGLSLVAMGCMSEARDLYLRALESAIQFRGRPSNVALLPALLLAEVHYEQNRLNDAQALLAQYLEMAGSKGFVDKLISGHITRARIAFVEGGFDHEAARRALDDAEHCARESGFERLRLHVLAERVRQLALCEGHEEAFFRAKREGLLGGSSAFVPREGVTSKDELLALTWARVAALRGNADGAQRLLKQWYQFTLARRCYRSTIHIALELASQLCARNSHTAATNYVRNALRLGRGELVRSFLDAAPAVQSILNDISAHSAAGMREEHRYAVDLVQARQAEIGIHRAPATPLLSAAAASASVFNKRELDILELAADDLSNRQIAQRLAISENTVKWYWKAIFSKLRVHRRAKAVSLARSTGMIF